MANSAARIAEIRQALSSTGKSVSDYSARFAAGRPPEQTTVESVVAAAAKAHQESVGSVLSGDDVHSLLKDLTKLSKARTARDRPPPVDAHRSRPRTCAAALWAATRRTRASWLRGCGPRDALRKPRPDLPAAAGAAVHHLGAGAQGPGAQGAGGAGPGEVASDGEPQGAETAGLQQGVLRLTLRAQEDIERQMKALESVKLKSGDSESLKEAQSRAAKAEQALAELTTRLSALEESNNVKTRALAAASQRAEDAEAAVLGLTERLALVEAAALSARTDTAAATVEEMIVVPTGKETPVALARPPSIDCLLPPHPPLQGVSGVTVLGSTLRVTGTNSHATYQWVRLNPDGSDEPVGGATRQQYAPEPRDVGKKLVCSVTLSPGEPPQLVTSNGAVSDMDGLASTVEAALAKESFEFNCVVVQRNGEMQDRREVHQLEVLADRVKLKRAGKTRFKESFSESMQVCGARGGVDAATQGLFLALSPSNVFMLAFESAKQRNAAILLIRKRAAEKNVIVLGPKDIPGSALGVVKEPW